MTVLLQNRARKRLAPHNKHSLVVLLQLVHQGNKIAVAADNRISIYVVMRERHFQCIQRQINIRAVLVPARRRITLHHLHRVFRQLPRRVLHLAPVCVSNLGDDFPALLQRLQHDGNIKLALQRGFYADLYIVEVNKDRDLEVFFHIHLFKTFLLATLY